MNTLIVKQPLRLKRIPDMLTQDFEREVLEGYLEYGWCDLHHLSDICRDFIVYALSNEYKEGEPFYFSNYDHSPEIDEEDIEDLKSDIARVLNHHRMFYALHGPDHRYRDDTYFNCFNMPFKGVW